MRHVAGPRVELGTRTIFNLLGPLANPAGAKRQLIGVFAPEWVEPMAEVLAPPRHRARLGRARRDGLDELTTAGTNQVAELDDGTVASFTVTPEDAGLPARRAATI